MRDRRLRPFGDAPYTTRMSRGDSGTMKMEVRDTSGGFDCRSVASAPRGRRRVSGRFRVPTAATGGGRYIMHDVELADPLPNLSRALKMGLIDTSVRVRPISGTDTRQVPPDIDRQGGKVLMNRIG